jgi:hypothetical protein
LPDVSELYEEHHEDGLEVVGVSIDDTADVAKRAIKRENLDWRQVCDGLKREGALCRAARVSGIPDSLVFGRDGSLRGRGARGLPLIELVEDLLREPYPKTR